MARHPPEELHAMAVALQLGQTVRANVGPSPSQDPPTHQDWFADVWLGNRKRELVVQLLPPPNEGEPRTLHYTIRDILYFKAKDPDLFDVLDAFVPPDWRT